MSERARFDARSEITEFGVLTEPTTLKIQRVLPGPIERVWSYLTTSELRRQWFAAGEMELTLGASFELVWRNDELTSPSGERPPGSSAEFNQAWGEALLVPNAVFVNSAVASNLAIEVRPVAAWPRTEQTIDWSISSTRAEGVITPRSTTS